MSGGIPSLVTLCLLRQTVGVSFALLSFCQLLLLLYFPLGPAVYFVFIWGFLATYSPCPVYLTSPSVYLGSLTFGEGSRPSTRVAWAFVRIIFSLSLVLCRSLFLPLIFEKSVITLFWEIVKTSNSIQRGIYPELANILIPYHPFFTPSSWESFETGFTSASSRHLEPGTPF